MRHRIFLGSTFLYLTVCNLIWIARDGRPPFWDMAAHQSGALRILNAVSEGGTGALLGVGSLSGFYPPLYHSIVAVFYWMFGVSTTSAQFANLPAMAILMSSTYFIGRRLVSPTTGATAAALVGFYPFLLWLSRETLIDYWLTSMVALAFWVLLESEGFQNRRMTVLFGLICGLGMLTKWTFVLFLFLPALWFARNRWKEASVAAIVALAVASYWYIPQFFVLSDLIAVNNAGGVAEGDPSRTSWQAIVFYVRALEGYQLFFPLFALFVAGLVRLARNFKSEWVPVVLWILGGWLGLMMFQNKDPRYSVAILPAVALISAAIFESRKAWLTVLLPFLMFQHYLVSFGIRALPERVIIAGGVQGPIAWDWNLYTQSHFDLWGRPEKQDWKIQYVLDRIGELSPGRQVRLGIIPDIPRFDSQAFEFYTLVRQDPVLVHRLARPDQESLRNNDFILLSEGAAEYPGSFAPEHAEVNRHVLDHPEQFEVVEWFPLPDGEVIRLYRVRAPS